MTIKDEKISSPDELRGNADFSWSNFDPEAYFHHYYGDPHPDDDRVTEAATQALAKCIPLERDLDIIDVGTGPNLIPFLAGYPRARTLTAWEYSDANIRWLKQELARSDLRPQWRHFWNVVQRASAAERAVQDDPLWDIANKANIMQGSIFELPRGQWDAATMFFCAESITQKMEEFEAACRSFAGCVRNCGTLAAAFLVRSEGYDVNGKRFPAISLSPQQILETFSSIADEVQIEQIGIVDHEVRSGYTGALFLSARGRGTN